MVIYLETKDCIYKQTYLTGRDKEKVYTFIMVGHRENVYT